MWPEQIPELLPRKNSYSSQWKDSLLLLSASLFSLFAPSDINEHAHTLMNWPQHNLPIRLVSLALQLHNEICKSLYLSCMSRNYSSNHVRLHCHTIGFKLRLYFSSFIQHSTFHICIYMDQKKIGLINCLKLIPHGRLFSCTVERFKLTVSANANLSSFKIKVTTARPTMAETGEFSFLSSFRQRHTDQAERKAEVK